MQHVAVKETEAPAEIATDWLDALSLPWLTPAEGFDARLKALSAEASADAIWRELVALANMRLTYAQTAKLDRAALRLLSTPPRVAGEPIRLAVLAASTVTHLLPSLRVAAIRRGMLLTDYVCDYGQYLQELLDERSALQAFRPHAVLFAMEPPQLTGGRGPSLSQTQADDAVRNWVEHATFCWKRAQQSFQCLVVQQTLLAAAPPILGGNEHRLPGSPRRLIGEINARLREASDEHGVDLLAVDQRAESDGVRVWRDPVLWHRAKYDVSPAAAPLYGDLLLRLLAARRGRSAKCLVLDLDNTLWGGVIGDDGLEGITLGNGSALGEAFCAFQSYVLELAKRGIILAVCSKNDEAVAWSAFDKHPEMLLRREDIACLVANWTDKAANLKTIAARLNIGLDSLVFVDDNPFERELVRRELPMIATPEVPDDPAMFARVLSDAGYFEGVAVTDEDRERTRLYGANAARDAELSAASDIQSYLQGLQMELIWNEFDPLGLGRITQLINKTNQFNLTTKRYSEEEVLAVMRDPKAFGLQLRLIDRFGDNGVIAVVIGRLTSPEEATIDTWLMSCRVLGRQVEAATLELVCERAQALGARRLVGEYKRTQKNAMVADHYEKLGFSPAPCEHEGSRAVLDLENRSPGELIMAVRHS